jgi:Trk K+ transport system NAD-binding subunit/multidrug transporter EmrE-like cation transporter
VTDLLAGAPTSNRLRRSLHTDGAVTAPNAPSDWSGHVIVCGLEGVGLRTVEQLRSTGVAVVVVDDDPAAPHALTVESWGCPYIAAAGNLEGQLRQAGLTAARAVVCTSRSDLRNVETALVARDLRADIDVVAHLDNPTVGRAVEEATGAGSALDVAGLFAPAVVDACMYRSSHDVVLGGERFVADEVGVAAAGTLRGLFGDLVPVGVVRSGGELIVCPGRDLGVGPGDRVTLLGKPDELAGAELSRAAEPERLPHQGGGSLRQFLRRASRTLAQGTDRAVAITLGLSLAMLVVATIVLRLAYQQGDGSHLSLSQAIYFTIETFATVGFGDFSFAHQSTAMQIFGILLIIAGVTLSTVILALITNALVSRRIEQSLGQGSIKGMDGHVVMVGLGAVGLRVLEGLRAQGRDVVVVERDESNRYVQHARGLGAPVVHGDATLGQTLRSVNLAQAGAVAILTSDDLVNLETGLAVRDELGARWSEVPVVLRVFDRALGSRLQQTFNFNHVWSTAALASPWFVGAVLGLEILATFYVRNQPFLVARLEVDEGGGLDGLAMQELGARIRVVAIARGGGDDLEYPPRRDTRLAAGDRAYLLGPYEELLLVLGREPAPRPDPASAFALSRNYYG